MSYLLNHSQGLNNLGFLPVIIANKITATKETQTGNDKSLEIKRYIPIEQRITMSESHTKYKTNLILLDILAGILFFTLGPLIVYLGYIVLEGSSQMRAIALAVFLEALIVSFQALLILHLHSKVFLLETLIELLAKIKLDKNENK